MPVTFIGLLNPIESEKISMTIAALVAASVQAVHETEHTQRTGLVPLNDADAQWIMKRWAEIERERGWAQDY